MIKYFIFLTAVATTFAATTEYSFAETDKCTAIIVGKSAGTEGPMTTHTADCSDCDFRIAKVVSICFLDHIMQLFTFHHCINLFLRYYPGSGNELGPGKSTPPLLVQRKLSFHCDNTSRIYLASQQLGGNSGTACGLGTRIYDHGLYSSGNY